MRRLRAISIKQPFAEQIMRGTKKREYRSRPTKVRGRVYVYASLRPRLDADWKGIRQGVGGPVRGKIVGTVEITGCERLGGGSYAWLLRAPKRLRRPLSPVAHPQPVWFFPFGK